MMNKDSGALSGSRADASSPQAVSTKGFDPARSDMKADLRMKIVQAIHEATDQYGTAAGIAAGKILAIPEIRDAINERERKDRPKIRLLPVMPSQRGGLARTAQKTGIDE